MSEAEEIARAAALFKSFHGREPRSGEIVAIPAPAGATVVLAVGKLLAVEYRSAGTGEDFHHDFEGPLPMLYVTADGAQAFVIGGGYRFTDRGFIK